MQDQLQFAHPIWIYAGVAACVGLLVAFRRFEQSRKATLARFASAGIVRRLLSGVSDRKRFLKRGLFVAGVALLFLALARPQAGFRWQEVKRRGIDIVFALDTSRSMLAEDVAPSRLERAKLGMMDFVDKLEGDRVGLIPFAGSAFTLCPLTLDYDAFRQSLEAASSEIIPHKGTDLASAIREGSVPKTTGRSTSRRVTFSRGTRLGLREARPLSPARCPGSRAQRRLASLSRTSILFPPATPPRKANRYLWRSREKTWRVPSRPPE